MERTERRTSRGGIMRRRMSVGVPSRRRRLTPTPRVFSGGDTVKENGDSAAPPEPARGSPLLRRGRRAPRPRPSGNGAGVVQFPEPRVRKVSRVPGPSVLFRRRSSNVAAPLQEPGHPDHPLYDSELLGARQCGQPGVPAPPGDGTHHPTPGPRSRALMEVRCRREFRSPCARSLFRPFKMRSNNR